MVYRDYITLPFAYTLENIQQWNETFSEMSSAGFINGRIDEVFERRLGNTEEDWVQQN